MSYTDDHNEDQIVENGEFTAVCAEDMTPGSSRMKVTLPPMMPALSGPLEAIDTQSTSTTTNPQGASETSTATVSNYAWADWMGVPNHLVHPLVKKGEQVRVTQVAKTSRYLWSELGRDSALRGLDRVVVGVSADSAVSDAPKSTETTYSLTVDPASGRVVLKTTKKNGEPFAYAIVINTKDGVLSIQDDSAEGKDKPPRGFILDSKSDIVQMSNSEGCCVRLDKRNVVIAAAEDIVMVAGRQIVSKAPQQTHMTEGASGKAAGPYIITAGGITLAGAKNVYVSAKSIMLAAPTKVAGPIVALAARLGRIKWGLVGSSYSPSTTDISNGTGVVADDAPDTDTDPAGQWQATSYEKFVDMVNHLMTLLNQVKTKTGAPTSSISELGDIAGSSNMENIRDKSH